VRLNALRSDSTRDGSRRRQVDRQEHVLADRLTRLRMLLDRAQDDAELLERVETTCDQLALL